MCKIKDVQEKIHVRGVVRSVSSCRMPGVLKIALFLSLAWASFGQQMPIAPPTMPPVPQDPARQNGGAGTQPGNDHQQSANLAGQPVNSRTYKIGPADVLSVRVWNEAEFSGPVAVHEDGMITLALVGDLKAGSMTPSEVEQEITTALKKYVVNPLVTVTVQEVGSKKYYMDGQIARAGEYPLVVPTTILEAISKAGGIQPFANGKKIYVLRGDQRIKFNYKDVLRGKNMSQNIKLKPGDHIVVP